MNFLWQKAIIFTAYILHPQVKYLATKKLPNACSFSGHMVSLLRFRRHMTITYAFGSCKCCPTSAASCSVVLASQRMLPLTIRGSQLVLPMVRPTGYDPVALMLNQAALPLSCTEPVCSRRQLPPRIHADSRGNTRTIPLRSDELRLWPSHT